MEEVLTSLYDLYANMTIPKIAFAPLYASMANASMVFASPALKIHSSLLSMHESFFITTSNLQIFLNLSGLFVLVYLCQVVVPAIFAVLGSLWFVLKRIMWIFRCLYLACFTKRKDSPRDKNISFDAESEIYAINEKMTVILREISSLKDIIMRDIGPDMKIGKSHE